MQNKLRQLVISALMRNEVTCDLDIHLTITGYEVTISGQVPTPDHSTEAVSTIQAVSSLLRVHNRLVVIQAAAYASV